MKEVAALDMTEDDLKGDDAPPEAKRAKGKAVAAPAAVAPERLSPVMQAIKTEDEKSLHDWLGEIGKGGAMRIVVRRESPREARDPVTGQMVSIEGYLHTYEERFDEEFLRNEHGGGKYNLRIMLPNAKGSFEYKAHRTMKIAGEPRIPGKTGIAVPGAASHSESPQMAKIAMDTMKELLDRKDGKDDHEPRGIDPSVQMMFEQMQETVRAREREVADMRRELSEMRHTKPPENPVLDRILTNAIDGNNGQVLALRTQHESEVRQLKEAAHADMARAEDRHDRAREAAERAHEREMMNTKQSYEREITALRQSHEVAIASMKATNDVQVSVLNADVRRLERDNAELRIEVKELREKKEKPLLEQIKDIKNLKDVIAGDEEQEDASTIGKIFGALTPENIGAVTSVFKGAAPAPAAPQQAQAQAPARPRIVVDAQGQRYKSDGTTLRPVTRKPKLVPGANGEAIEIPVVDPADLKRLISYLESSFGAGADPEIVAQSGRSAIPADILAWLRKHHSPEMAGIDLFMQKVAQLPGESPLSSQSGKNWLRKVGAALIE